MPWLSTCDAGMIQELKDVKLHPNLVSYNAAAWLKLEGALEAWLAIDCQISALMPEFRDRRECDRRSLPSFEDVQVIQATCQ